MPRHTGSSHNIAPLLFGRPRASRFRSSAALPLRSGCACGSAACPACAGPASAWMAGWQAPAARAGRALPGALPACAAATRLQCHSGLSSIRNDAREHGLLSAACPARARPIPELPFGRGFMVYSIGLGARRPLAELRRVASTHWPSDGMTPRHPTACSHWRGTSTRTGLSPACKNNLQTCPWDQ